MGDADRTRVRLDIKAWVVTDGDGEQSVRITGGDGDGDGEQSVRITTDPIIGAVNTLGEHQPPTEAAAVYEND